MELFSICLPCEVLLNFDGHRQWGDIDKCPKCSNAMDIYTDAGVRNENNRRWYGGKEPLRVTAEPRNAP